VSAREARTNAEKAFAEWVQERVNEVDYLDLIAMADDAGVGVDDLEDAFMDAEISIMWSTPVKKESK
jgi:hypothetical protein